MTITVEGKTYTGTVRDLRRKTRIVRAKGNVKQRKHADLMDKAIDKHFPLDR